MVLFKRFYFKKTWKGNKKSIVEKNKSYLNHFYSIFEIFAKNSVDPEIRKFRHFYLYFFIPFSPPNQHNKENSSITFSSIVTISLFQKAFLRSTISIWPFPNRSLKSAAENWIITLCSIHQKLREEVLCENFA